MNCTTTTKTKEIRSKGIYLVSSNVVGEYEFKDLCIDVLSPGAVGVMEQLTSEILEIYQLDQLLETRLPVDERKHHQQLLEERLTRVSKLLPSGVSPMPNEIFTAIEFLIYQYESRPVHLGQAIARLELLAAEFRAHPLIYSLVTGRAN